MGSTLNNAKVEHYKNMNFLIRLQPPFPDLYPCKLEQNFDRPVRTYVADQVAADRVFGRLSVGMGGCR